MTEICELGNNVSNISGMSSPARPPKGHHRIAMTLDLPGSARPISRPEKCSNTQGRGRVARCWIVPSSSPNSCFHIWIVLVLTQPQSWPQAGRLSKRPRKEILRKRIARIFQGCSSCATFELAALRSRAQLQSRCWDHSPRYHRRIRRRRPRHSPQCRRSAKSSNCFGEPREHDT